MKTDNRRQQIITKLALQLFGAGLMAVGQPVGAISLYSEIFTPNTGTQSDAGISVMLASDFKPLLDGVITDVAWQGIYLWDGTPQGADNFTINFYADSAGSVGTLIHSFAVGSSVNRALTSHTYNGKSFFGYTASIGDGIVVSDESRYWISIVNNTSSDALDNWFWATNTDLSGPGSVASDSTNGGAGWNARTGDSGSYYVALSGNVSTVPVPPTLALMLPSLAMLGFMVRRRKHFNPAAAQAVSDCRKIRPQPVSSPRALCSGVSPVRFGSRWCIRHARAYPEGHKGEHTVTRFEEVPAGA